MNTPVSFPLAKLLKEKRFDEPCISFYDLVSNQQINNAPLGNYNLTKQSVSIPTIADVVMWLYEKYGVWISVHEYQNVFSWGIQKFDLGSVDNFNSPKEAYQNAIEYVLTHLVTPNETDPQV